MVGSFSKIAERFGMYSGIRSVRSTKKSSFRAMSESVRLMEPKKASGSADRPLASIRLFCSLQFWL